MKKWKLGLIVFSPIILIGLFKVLEYQDEKMSERLSQDRVKAEKRLKNAKKSKDINPLVTELFGNYVKYWSDQDLEKIADEIYGLPFTLYNQEDIVLMTSKDQIATFLKNTFIQLEENNYGYSITNSFDHYKEDGKVIIIEMNFTRFLKDGTVMGEKERKASYILKNIDDSFKIVALIPHSPIEE